MKKVKKKSFKKLILCATATILAGVVFMQGIFAMHEWVYTVRTGDTLSEIIERELGLPWRSCIGQVKRLNPRIDTETIHPGQLIKMPEGKIRERKRLEQEDRIAREKRERQRKLDLGQLHKRAEDAKQNQRDLDSKTAQANQRLEVAKQAARRLAIELGQATKRAEVARQAQRDLDLKTIQANQRAEAAKRAKRDLDAKTTQSNQRAEVIKREIRRLETELQQAIKRAEVARQGKKELDSKTTQSNQRAENAKQAKQVLNNKLTGAIKKGQIENEEIKALEEELEQINRKILAEELMGENLSQELERLETVLQELKGDQ